jgi:uncharacterized protein (DUF1697 family)
VTSHILLLRAINVGPRRLAMPALRELLSGAGLQDVRTYLQSGNAVVRSDAAPERLAAECRSLISEHAGFDVPVIVRTEAELDEILAKDPLSAVANEPKRYWVSFLDAELPPERVERLNGLARDGERVLSAGRELYAWLPGGAARSKLATAMAAPAPEVTATARNWATVTALLELARGAR